MSKKSLSAEEREQLKRKAFEARCIDYDEYCREAEQKKLDKVLQKQRNVENSMYHKNHEDDVQFGCCGPDTLAPCFSDQISGYLL